LAGRLPPGYSTVSQNVAEEVLPRMGASMRGMDSALGASLIPFPLNGNVTKVSR
jgi:hypothetical protein